MSSPLDAAAVHRWCRVAVDALAAARAEIDALNVYPIPDGDTGTNMLLTMIAARDAVESLSADSDLRTTLAALARGALLGARGNSGVILSQMLRGAADVLAVGPDGCACPVAAALRRAADLGYAAVAVPVEGTMLTVGRAAAQAASAPAKGDRSAIQVAADAARAALRRTPDQLDVLRRAGVVDAGGRGLCVLLDALVSIVTGHAEPPAAGRVTAAELAAESAGADVDAQGPAYEVMYLLDTDEDAAGRLRAALAAFGESVVVVGGNRLWNVHAHVHDVGAAIEAGMAAGRPHRIRVTHFADAGRDGGAPPGIRRSIVSVVAGDGLSALSEAAGATVVRGGPGRRASTAELLDGIRRTRATEVVLLPNDTDSLAVAEAAAVQARGQGLRVAVVPTRASVQALAALAVHDPDRRFDDDVVAMTAAAAHTRHGAVTIATRQGWTTAGVCRAGDVLGVIDGDFVIIGDDLAATACTVLDRMLSAGGELVTLVTGRGADPALAPTVVSHMRRLRPEVDAVVYDGGQPRYPLLLGVE